MSSVRSGYTPPSRLRRRFLGLFAILAMVGWISARQEWEAIPPEDLQAVESKEYPGVAAEALLSRIDLVGAPAGDRADNFRRIKIYNVRGVEEHGVLAIDSDEEQRIWDLAARVVKPDGSSREYRDASFHESTVARLGRTRLKRRILAVPDLGPGDIVDLKWSASLEGDAFYSWYSQLEIPVRQCSFHAETMQRASTTMWFNVPGQRNADRKGSRSLDLQMNNIAPFREEPLMPPERDIRGWFMIIFRHEAMRGSKGDDLFQAISAYEDEEFRRRTKPEAAITRKSVELVAGVASREDQLKRLYEYCQESIRNLAYETSAELQVADKRLGTDRLQFPKDTLARGTGDPRHINDLFAALARAAGFEVAQGLATSRSLTLKAEGTHGWLFLRDPLVLVWGGSGWQAFAPGDYQVPPGLLDVTNQGVPFLRCAKNRFPLETSRVATADESTTTRRGRLRLDAEGNLEGEIELTLRGYPAIEAKRRARGEQAATTEQRYREELSARIAGAEMSEFSAINLTGVGLPVVVRSKIRIPAYADVIGNRLVLPLAFFERGSSPLFTSETREHPVHFNYAHRQIDEIEYLFPESYELPLVVRPQAVGNPEGELGVGYKVSHDASVRAIHYERNFSLGVQGRIDFEAREYPRLKSAFDRIRASDDHALILVRTTPAEGAGPNAGTAP
jgi:hypothetical protein